MISQIYPCSFRPINSSFSGTPSSSHHSTAPTLLLWRRRCSRAPRTPTKAFLHQSRSLQSSSLRGKWPSTSPSLRLVHHPISCTFTMSGSSAFYFTEHPPFFSFCSCSSFLPLKLLGSVQQNSHPYRSAIPPVSWSIREPRSHRFD